MTTDPVPAPGFRAAQIRVLSATMFCYLFFYTGRQTFGFAIPGIEQELGISKATLGWASAALLWSYALGQFINGNLGDVYGGRRLMSLGAWLSCLLNWVVSYGQSLAGIMVPWTLNGYAQSMGWAPGSRVLSNWFSHHERALAYGGYLFAAGLSSVLAYATSTLILEYQLSWRWIFRLPVLLMLLGGTLYYLLVRDRPEDLGFTLPEDAEPSAPDWPGESSAADSLTVWQRYQVVLANRSFLIASLAIGFQSMARYGLLIWVPVHFLGEDWTKSDSKWISLALPIGMALGAVTSGWISDVLLKSNRSRVIGIFLTAAGISGLAMSTLDRSNPWGILLLFLTGFFAYGPQSAFWALCPDLLGKKYSGTGTGVMNTSAYLFAGLGEPLIGWWIETTHNTALIFVIVGCSCFLGAVLSLAIREPTTPESA